MSDDTNNVEKTEEKNNQPIAATEDPLFYRVCFFITAGYAFIVSALFLLLCHIKDEGTFFSALGWLITFTTTYLAFKLLDTAFAREERLLQSAKFWSKKIDEGGDGGAEILASIFYFIFLLFTVVLAHALTICLRYMFPKK